MNVFVDSWYKKRGWTVLLWPLSVCYRFVVFMRRLAYRCKVFKTHHFNVPIIVVGNMTVGGTGKTPLVIELVQQLKALGYQPGVVSRGYRATASRQPCRVSLESDPQEVGDEPLLIARRTQVPVVIGRDRVAAVKELLAEEQCTIVISDDGLQHYALGRDLEIAVIDGLRRFGNGLCLPAGPLRESVSRLKQVDVCVVNGGACEPGEVPMTLRPGRFVNVLSGQETDQLETPVYAVAGIGNPHRFFMTLDALGLQYTALPFPDHHRFTQDDFAALAGGSVVMTEKDAVKCAEFAEARFWMLPVSAEIGLSFLKDFLPVSR